MPGRVLAIDIGSKRVGFALSDELCITVRPLPALRRSSWKHLVKYLKDLCVEFDVKKVVLGLPLRLDGSVGDAAKEAERIARNLNLSLGLPVELQDERYTSKAAEANLRHEGVSAEKISELVDSESAAIILNDFLARLSVAPESE
jgi:putative holliday junction resolvase